MLKGFLVDHSVEPPKKHDLSLLCDACIDLDDRFTELSDICDFLTAFSVQPRYPNELEILEEDADKALRNIRQIMDFFEQYSAEPMIAESQSQE